jgi:hypothetical protein
LNSSVLNIGAVTESISPWNRATKQRPDRVFTTEGTWDTTEHPRFLGPSVDSPPRERLPAAFTANHKSAGGRRAEQAAPKGLAGSAVMSTMLRLAVLARHVFGYRVHVEVVLPWP